MDLAHSDEQRLLKDSVDSYITRRYGFAYRTDTACTTLGFSREVWGEMASFGWLALPLPSAHGGLDGGAVDVSLLMEGFGRGLVLEPYVSSVLLGGGLIAAAGTPAQQSAHLPELAEGRLLLAFAHAEPQARLRFGQVATRALRDGDGWQLDGAKSVVLDGPSADRFVVSARVNGAPDDAAGLALFVVSADAPGLQRTDYLTVDGRRASNLVLDGVRVDAMAWLGEIDDAGPIVDAVVDRANAALCADLLGTMQALLDATVAYTKTRVQFGQPIAMNQVLRHRMARMAIACEEARSMALLAALKVDARDTTAAERARAVSGAKVKVVESARYVAEQAVQLHGAIGVTEELNVGAYLKRVLAQEAMLGTLAEHLRRYAAQPVHALDF